MVRVGVWLREGGWLVRVVVGEEGWLVREGGW